MMYRWFLLLAVISIAHCNALRLCRTRKARYCRPSRPQYYGLPHNFYHGVIPDTPVEPTPSEQSTVPATFEDLAQNLIAAETAIRQFCRDNSRADVREVYGTENYILKYTFTGFEDKDVTVKIKHSVLSVTAERPGVSTFKDLRILPSIVDTSQAIYVVENSLLKIFIPYRIKRGVETAVDCGNVNDNIINVAIIRSDGAILRSIPEKNKGDEASTPHYQFPPSPQTENTDSSTDTLDSVLASIFDTSSDINSQIDIRNNYV